MGKVFVVVLLITGFFAIDFDYATSLAEGHVDVEEITAESNPGVYTGLGQSATALLREPTFHPDSLRSEGLSDPTLATNPSGIADWQTSVPFIDLMKQSRPWYSTGVTRRDWHYLSANGHLDGDGWPLTLPTGGDFFETIWAWSEDQGNYNANQSFTLEWEGAASVEVAGAVTDVVTNANSIKFNMNSSGGIIVLRIKPLGSAPNNPRNFSLIRDEHLALYDAGERLNPDYLLFNQDMRLLRFMDWMQTNWSDIVEWDDRPRLADVTYSNINDEGNSVPIELIVEICNKIQSDCWVNFPHMASDEYITQLTKYVRDNLDSDLIAHYELSNEVWNSAFPHGQYFLAQARSEWPGASSIPDFQIILEYYGKRAAEAFTIVNALYAGIEDRRINVLGSLIDSNSWLSEQTMLASSWKSFGSNYVKPSSVAQALAIAPYYGVGMYSSNVEVIEAAYAAGTHIEWIYNYLTDPENDDSVPASVSNMGVQKAAAAAEGLDLIMYEGMRHYLTGGLSSGDSLAAMLEFARSDEDAYLVMQMWEGWERLGDGPLMVFSDFYTFGTFGAWGMVEYYGDTSPYAEVLTALNNWTPNWWNGTGDYRGEKIVGAVDYRIARGTRRPSFSRKAVTGAILEE